MDIIEEKFVSWADARKILEKKAKEKELGYEQKNALEHLRKFSRMTQKSLTDLDSELSKIERLKDRHRTAITDMLPSDDDELKMIFSNDIITISDEDKKKIIAVVKKFAK